MEVRGSARVALYYRLIALWAVCEGVLGGLLHGLRLPVTGLVVGSASVLCICLIAHLVPGRARILRAALVVAAIKMMLSPHSPLPAYFAVFFQALAGQLLFSFGRRLYPVSAFLLAVTALLESAVQRVLTLTLIYGREFWKAVDIFLSDLTHQKAEYSIWLVSAYLGVHLVVGILLGWFAASLPRRLGDWQGEPVALPDIEASPTKRHSRWRKGFFLIWLGLLLLLVQSWVGPGEPWLPGHLSLQILFRSLVLVLTWYFLLGPLLLLLFRNWLQARVHREEAMMTGVLALLPEMRKLVRGCWQAAATQSGGRRLTLFCKLVLAHTLRHD